VRETSTGDSDAEVIDLLTLVYRYCRLSYDTKLTVSALIDQRVALLYIYASEFERLPSGNCV